MRKLVALLFAVMLLAPALALAQDQSGTPAPGDTSGQTTQPSIALAAPEALQRAIDDVGAQQFDQAVLQSSLFILLNPTYARGYFVRGVAYQGLKKLPEALADLTTALPLAAGTPGQASIYASRARLFIGTNQLPEAVSDLTNAIKINPTSDLYALRAQVLMQQLDFASAIKDLNQAIQLTPTDGSLFLVRASAYDAMGNRAEAASDYVAWISSQKPQALTGQPVNLGASFRLDMTADKLYEVPINAKKGQSVSIAAASLNGNIDPLIALLDPDNQPLIASDDVSSSNQNSLISNFVIPADGVYLLMIFHAGGGTDGQVGVQIRGQ